MELPPSGSGSFLTVVLCTALCFVVSISLLHRLRRKKYRLPPGPRPWPVIGNLNLIGHLPHHSVHELSKKYGPLMTVRLGSLPAVVGANVDMARLFLKTHDLALIDRPRMASGKYTGYDYTDMLWSPYGAHWRQSRRLWKAEVFSSSRLRLHEHTREGEIRAMLGDIYRLPAAAAGGRGRLVVLMDHLFAVNINVISLMVLGKKYVAGETDGSPSATTPEEFKWMVEEFFRLSAPLINIGDTIPWLNWLDLNGCIKRLKKLRNTFDRFLDHVVEEHNERRLRQGKDFVPADMVDLLLELADSPDLEVPIDRTGVKAHTMNLLVGLPDTTSVTVEWAMSEMLKNPDMMAKVTKELDRVVGSERHVAEADIPSLQYLDAIIKETMRLHPVAPLLAPRAAREDVSVEGYDIPTGTLVFVNIWAIARDPAIWGPDAEVFRPERFVGSSLDVKGNYFELLPFGSGRRMCPGISLGLKMVNLILANLLHAYSWRLPDGVAIEDLDMEEKFGLSMPRKIPLQAVAEPRLPEHLYAAAP